MKKIKVYTVAHEGVAPKCMGTMKVDTGESFFDLPVRLKGNKVLDFAFSFGIQKSVARWPLHSNHSTT